MTKAKTGAAVKKKTVAAPTKSGPKKTVLSGEDAATVAAGENAIKAKLMELAMLRDQYLNAETRLTAEIQQARAEFQAVVKTMAGKNGVDLSTGRWNFNVDDMTFSPVNAD